MRAKGWGSVIWRAQVRSMARTGVAEGIVELLFLQVAGLDIQESLMA